MFFIHNCYGIRLILIRSKLLYHFQESGKKNENGELKPSRFYKLYVEWDKWSKAKKTIFRKELENAQKDSQEALNARNKERAQVFFIGKQDIKNPEIFYASDFRLICVIMGYIMYPEYN